MSPLFQHITNHAKKDFKNLAGQSLQYLFFDLIDFIQSFAIYSFRMVAVSRYYIHRIGTYVSTVVNLFVAVVSF
jgi:hypothetical protein